MSLRDRAVQARGEVKVRQAANRQAELDKREADIDKLLALWCSTMGISPVPERENELTTLTRQGGNRLGFKKADTFTVEDLTFTAEYTTKPEPRLIVHVVGNDEQEINSLADLGKALEATGI